MTKKIEALSLGALRKNKIGSWLYKIFKTKAVWNIDRLLTATNAIGNTFQSSENDLLIFKNFSPTKQQVIFKLQGSGKSGLPTYFIEPNGYAVFGPGFFAEEKAQFTASHPMVKVALIKQ